MEDISDTETYDISSGLRGILFGVDEGRFFSLRQ